jgi:hypothetical protein
MMVESSQANAHGCGFAVSVFFLNHANIDIAASTSTTTFRDVRFLLFGLSWGG